MRNDFVPPSFTYGLRPSRVVNTSRNISNTEIHSYFVKKSAKNDCTLPAGLPRGKGRPADGCPVAEEGKSFLILSLEMRECFRTFRLDLTHSFT